MIPQYLIDDWRQDHHWPYDYQVEQDIIISRALIEMYQQPKVAESLVFRGGTALNKVYLNPAMRYSEDIDFVQIRPEPIGDTLDAIRTALDPWLGKPKRKLTEFGAKLYYRYLSSDNVQMKLKLEINTTEHFHIFDFVQHSHMINNDWFSGNTNILTYELKELMGTKLRALYQRRKGRDLFDMWIILKNQLASPEDILNVYYKHCERDGNLATRAIFEKNLYEKSLNSDFRNDVRELLSPDANWDFDEAYWSVKENIINLMPGNPWANDKNK